MRFTNHNNGVSTTANQQLSALFHYNGVFLSEVRRDAPGPRGLIFCHTDPECEALELEQRFFEPDGDYVTSARELFRADREVRQAVRRFLDSERQT
jgi:hypothetical protein